MTSAGSWVGVGAGSESGFPVLTLMDPEAARDLIDRVHARLEAAGYEPVQTPYGYFNDLTMEAPGHPLARIYKEF